MSALSVVYFISLFFSIPRRWANWSPLHIISHVSLAFHEGGLLCLIVNWFFSLSRYNLGFTGSCKTGSRVLINKIVKMLAYLMAVAMWRIQYCMNDFDIWVTYKSILKISKRKEDKHHNLNRIIVYNWFCKFFFHSGDILYFSPQKYTIGLFCHLCSIYLPYGLTSLQCLGLGKVT